MKKRFNFYKLAKFFNDYSTLEKLRLFEWLFLKFHSKFDVFIQRHRVDPHISYKEIKTDSQFFADIFSSILLDFTGNGYSMDNTFIKNGVRILEIGNYSPCDFDSQMFEIKEYLGKKIIFNSYDNARVINSIYFCFTSNGLSLKISDGYCYSCTTHNFFIKLGIDESFDCFFKRVKVFLNKKIDFKDSSNADMV